MSASLHAHWTARILRAHESERAGCARSNEHDARGRASPALIVSALAAAVVATAGLALDRIFPPDLARYHERSTEVVDANGRLLRAFTTTDGMWRLKTTADDVDPVYLALLKAYEDSRFALHPGVDPLSVVRATGQLIAHGRIVSGASTITMQAARLLEPRPRTFVNKVIEAARAVQLEWRYSKREVMAIYLTLAPMGGNLEGARAASLAYFGKEPQTAQRGRSRPAGRHPAVADAPPARALLRAPRKPAATACWCAGWRTA